MARVNNKSLFILSGIVIACLIGVQLYWIWNNISLQKTTIERALKEDVSLIAKDIEDNSSCFNMYAKTQFNRGEGFYLIKQSYKDGRFYGPEQGGKIDTINMFNLFEVNIDTFINDSYIGFDNYNAKLDVALKFELLLDSNYTSDAYSSKTKTLNINNFKDLLRENKNLSTIINYEHLNADLKKVLIDNSLDTNYSLGIKRVDSVGYEYLSDNAFVAGLNNSKIRASFLGDEFNAPYELVIFIPNSFTNIIKSMSIMMISSIIIIIILIMLYGYFVKTILDQKRLSAMKNTFINNITHEFKTPITNINLAIENWKDVKGNSEVYMNVIKEENEHMYKNVEQILQLATLENTGVLEQKSEFDIHNLLKDVISKFEMQLQRIHTTIDLQFNATDAYISANKEQIADLFHNLIDNAIKYSSDNPKISIATFNTNGNLVIQVSDNGIGMKAEAQKHVFENFYRENTSDTHDVKGFGLGLSYAKYIVDLHKGEIVLKSKQGKGTVFTIYLPKK
ncbi:MAG: HAMP domain-containing sensor histidine kinase [Flavipsychrobacter sp.]